METPSDPKNEVEFLIWVIDDGQMSHENLRRWRLWFIKARYLPTQYKIQLLDALALRGFNRETMMKKIRRKGEVL